MELSLIAIDSAPLALESRVFPITRLGRSFLLLDRQGQPIRREMGERLHA
jgi:hypothetical protein